MITSIRWKRRLVSCCYHTGIFMLAVIGNNQRIALLFWIGIIDLLFFRVLPITRYLQTLFIRSAVCGCCQNKQSLRSQWQCESCGYTYQNHQHLFDPCPNCQGKFSYFQCSSCGAGILV